MRSYGLSVNYLPSLYKQVISKQLKQYLWTALYAQEVYNLCLIELAGNFTTALVQKLNELLRLRGDLW